jgi:ribosomal protein L37E
MKVKCETCKYKEYNMSEQPCASCHKWPYDKENFLNYQKEG